MSDENISELGRDLRAIRERIVASGEPLLDSDGIAQYLGGDDWQTGYDFAKKQAAQVADAAEQHAITARKDVKSPFLTSAMADVARTIARKIREMEPPKI
jgi:hypothetical protein